MSEINLGATEADRKVRPKRYRYLQSYVDQTGRKRTYLRRRNRPLIPLPEPESPDFSRAYQTALQETGVPMRRIAPPMTFRTRRRLKNQHPDIGVYLLLYKGVLTYIGSSKNMVARVAEHHNNGRPYDQAFYISTTEGERLPLEKLLIKSLQPKQNRVGV